MIIVFLELRGPLSQEVSLHLPSHAKFYQVLILSRRCKSSGDVGHCGHLSALARCHDYILFIGSTSVVSITIANCEFFLLWSCPGG